MHIRLDFFARKINSEIFVCKKLFVSYLSQKLLEYMQDMQCLGKTIWNRLCRMSETKL